MKSTEITKMALKDAALQYLINDSNVWGEFCRDQIFNQEKGFGCYSTFELRDDFKYVKQNVIPKWFLDAWYDESGWHPDYGPAYFVTNGIIYGAYFWDGDGTLMVGTNSIGLNGRNIIALNTDCKKDNYWNFV